MLTNKLLIVPGALVSLTFVSGFLLSSTFVSADDIVDNVAITVPVSCTMSGTGMNTHTKEVANGTYEANIGTTTMKVLCNDNSGFSIYATGFTNETIAETNSNKLVGTNASGNATIDTGIAQSGNTSNWAMKLATNSQATYPITITSDTEGPFSSYHTIPSTWTKVATRLAGTDIGAGAEGSTITSTYAAYINTTQPADTYHGKVKYTMIHPNNGAAPGTFDAAYAAAGKTRSGNYYVMQDMANSNICANVSINQTTILKDSRDDKTYNVAKLADGNCWMTQNLDHDIVTDGSVVYNSTTTDLPANNTWEPSVATYATNNTTWVNVITIPESYDPGDLCWNGVLDVNWDTTLDTGTIACSDNRHYHIGNYYNWTAAIAVNDSSNYTADNEDINQSICPAGWRLPIGGTANTGPKSFDYLVNQLGLTTGTSGNIQNNPVYFVFGGEWYGESFLVGSGGLYWSSVARNRGTYDGEIASSLGFYADSDSDLYPKGIYGRDSALSVRCVAR